MTVTAPPIGARLIRAWLLPLGNPVAAERKPTDPLPQRVVHRIGGPADRLTDHGLYSIHDFASAYTPAEDAAQDTFERVCQMGPPFSPQRPITLQGRTFYVDRIDVDEYPHPEHYSDTVKRFVGTYRIHLRFVPVA